jgi:hypothetical protein
MARVQQHGATRQRMPLADRPLKSRDRRAANGNGTAFSAVAPSSGPYWPPVDPITREWYRPQARIDDRLTFQPAARFRPSGDSHQHRPEAWRICHIPERKSRSSFKNLHMRDGTSSCSWIRSSAKSGNAARGGADLYEAGSYRGALDLRRDHSAGYWRCVGLGAMASASWEQVIASVTLRNGSPAAATPGGNGSPLAIATCISIPQQSGASLDVQGPFRRTNLPQALV